MLKYNITSQYKMQEFFYFFIIFFEYFNIIVVAIMVITNAIIWNTLKISVESFSASMPNVIGEIKILP